MKELNLDTVKKPLGFINEFKEFAMRGNVVDLAVGVVIGAAFGKIVTSMVGDIITPIIGKLTGGGGDLKDKFFSLAPEKTQDVLKLADAQKLAPVIAYGQFLSAIIDFIIVAFFIFLVVKLMNRFKQAPPAPAPAPEPTAEEKLLVEIRDILKARS
jgi:large conductance mechanosensitive channel